MVCRRAIETTSFHKLLLNYGLQNRSCDLHIAVCSHYSGQRGLLIRISVAQTKLKSSSKYEAQKDQRWRKRCSTYNAHAHPSRGDREGFNSLQKTPDSSFSNYLFRSQLQHMGSRSLTRDRTWAPALGARSLSHCTTREVPLLAVLSGKGHRGERKGV